MRRTIPALVKSLFVKTARRRPGLKPSRWRPRVEELEGRCVPASFQGLGGLPGGQFFAEASAVSADGSVVVGFGTSASGYSEAFRWTEASGMVGLGYLPGGVNSRATGVSADGSVVVGDGNTTVAIEPFRWTAGSGMVGLGNLSQRYNIGRANGVSADGSVVVGDSDVEHPSDSIGSTPEAFRWTAGSGMVGLGSLDAKDPYSEAWAASADGSVVVGDSDSPVGHEAFRWTAGSGMVRLGGEFVPGHSVFSYARGVSADGSVVVGYYLTAAGHEAFRWTAGSGIVGLGELPGGGFTSLARGVSADGSVVVGASSAGPDDGAFIWDSTHKMRSLRDVLLAEGLAADLLGWRLFDATAISADGTTVVGWGLNPNGQHEAWIARLSPSVDVRPTLLNWNTTDSFGGVKVGYSNSAALPAPPADKNWTYDLYWSDGSGAPGSYAKLSRALIGPAVPLQRTKDSPTDFVHADQIAAPPPGATHLLFEVNSQGVAGEDRANNQKLLEFDPKIELVSSTYDGDNDLSVIGRFFSRVPVAGESVVFRLTKSLAALRPDVKISFDGPARDALKFDDGRGWDGLTYTTGEFDPGLFDRETPLKVEASRDGTSLGKQGAKIDVIPLPEWFGAWSFDDKRFDGGLKSYVFSGPLFEKSTFGLKELLTPPTIPGKNDNKLLDVWFAPLSANGVSASVAVRIVSDLAASTPDVSSTVKAKLVLQGQEIAALDYDSRQGDFKLTPSLNARTLDLLGLGIALDRAGRYQSNTFFEGTELATGIFTLKPRLSGSVDYDFSIKGTVQWDGSKLTFLSTGLVVDVKELKATLTGEAKLGFTTGSKDFDNVLDKVLKTAKSWHGQVLKALADWFLKPTVDLYLPLTLEASIKGTATFEDFQSAPKVTGVQGAFSLTPGRLHLKITVLKTEVCDLSLIDFGGWLTLSYKWPNP